MPPTLTAAGWVDTTMRTAGIGYAPWFCSWRWSGLAIKDAVTLERQRIDADGNLFLYRAKTGVPVYVPLPPDVLELLQSLPNSNPRYFFWSGNGDPETIKRGWTRTLARLFKIADIRRPDKHASTATPTCFATPLQ